MGHQLPSEPVPEWFEDFEDAEALGVAVWDVGKVPEHWRVKARLWRTAKREARVEIFNKFKGQRQMTLGPLGEA